MKPSSPSRVISAIELVNVRLVRANARTEIASADEAGEGAAARISHKSKALENVSNGAFRVLAKIEVLVTPPDRPDHAVVEVEGAYELTYRVPKGFTASDEELRSFAEVNATFHAWPYWREFVHAVFGRMGLPPIVLPVMRMPRSTSELDRHPRDPSQTKKKAVGSH